MGEIDNQMKSVSFTRMADGTAEEYAFLTPLYEKCRNGVSDRLLELLKAMKGDKLVYQVDRYTHSLQSATRAESDGADEETVVCALLHDLGDVIAPDNHSEVIASILRPYISEKNHWVLKHHGLFQANSIFITSGETATKENAIRIMPFIRIVSIFVKNGIKHPLILITPPYHWNTLNRWFVKY